MSDGFEGLTDEEVIAELKDLGNYAEVRKLSTGEWVGLNRLMFTWAVQVCMTRCTAYRYRWCFKEYVEAKHFFDVIERYDEIPSERGSLTGHRYLDKPLLVELDENGFKRW